MRTQSIKSRFAKYVSLNVIGMVGISLYILADTFFISKALGALGITALNFNIAVYSILHGTGLMIGIGGASRYSIFKGLKKYSDADSTLMNSLFLGAVASLIFLTAGILFSTDISLLLGADDETLAYSEVYMCTILCFSPCFILNNIISAFVRNDGAPGICTIAMIAGNITNIILDYIFIFPMNMGMYGAVLATGFSPIVSMSILAVHLRKNPESLRLSRFIPSMHKMLSLMKLGLSAFISELSSAVSVIAFNFIMLEIGGNIAVASYGIVANTALVASAIFTGVSQGVQPIASSEYGNDNKPALSNIAKYSVITTFCISAVVFLSVFFFAECIASFFNGDGDKNLEALAVNGLRLYFTGFAFAGLNIVISSFFSSVDMPGKAFVSSFLRSSALLVPIVIALSLAFGINGTWLSFAVTEFIALVATFVNLRRSGYLGKTCSACE
ncbi:MAG: MATE family efflux transporter [Ruminococcus sp.]|nr:MATE family efflux transporter [Ruminococcus sp.]